MAKQSKITRERVADNDIFTIGTDYAKSLQPAIQANKAWLDTFPAIKKAALEYVEIEKQFKKAGNKSQFIKSKEKEKQLSEQTSVALKEQQSAELNLIKTIERKKIASEGTNRELIKQRVELQQLNRRIKETAVLSSSLSTVYEKQSVRLNQLRRQYKDVALVQGENSVEARRLQAEVQKLDTTLKRVDANVGQFQRNVGNYRDAMKSAAEAARNMAAQLGLVGGAILFTRVMREAFQTIQTFDRQLIAVGKTTGIVGEPLKEFGREVIELGVSLDGISIEGLLSVAEIAGQIGLKSTADILKFSETIERLRISSDITGDESAQNFAKFIEVSKDAFENADRLGSVITRLGNNFATTESQVLKNASEIQKAVSIYEASAQSVLGLGAATSALGSEAETSRTAIQKTFGEFNNAIISGKNLEQILRLTGLTQKELSQQFNTDATSVFQKFIKGLNEVQKSGGNLGATLQELGIVEVRQATVIGALATNYGVLESALDQANDEYITNTALTEESAAAAESISSIIGDLKDNWQALVLRTSDANGITQTIIDTLKFLRDNLETIIKLITVAVASWVSYRVVMFSISAATGLYQLAVNGLTVAKVALTGGIKAATVQMQAFNVTTKANPLGLLVGVLSTAVIAFAAFSDGASKSVESLKRLRKQADETKKSIVEQDIAMVNSQLNRIELESATQEEALRKKVAALDENIQKQLEGTANLYSTEEEMQEASKKKQLEKEKEYAEDVKTIRMGTMEDLQSSGGLRLPSENEDPDVPDYRITGNAEIEAQKEVVKQLREMRAELLKSIRTQNEQAAEEGEKANAERLKKERDDEVALINFINEYKIETLKKFASDESNEFETRQEALEQAQKIELQLIEFNTLEKLKTVRKGSNEEKLILAQTAKEKREIEEKYYDESVELAARDLERKANIGKSKKEQELAEELERENQAFLQRTGIYEQEERAVELREKRIADIKKKYAIKALEVQIKAIKTLLKAGELSDEQRASAEAKLAELKLRLSEIVTSGYIENNERREMSEAETAARIEDLSRQLAYALVDLINNISAARIERIEQDIQANEKFHNNLLENENLTEQERERIEIAAEKRRKELEDQKRKEQKRQAIFNKVLASAEAAVNTALAITKVMPNPILIALTAALGAAQIAAIVSTPIPAYYLGTEDHPGGKALVGEYQPEVVTEPGKKPYIIDKPTIKHFPKHTKVTPSLEEYQALMKASIMTSLQMDGKRLNDYQAKTVFDKNSDAMLEEMRLSRKAFEKQKQPIHIHQPKIDLGHQLWRLNNLS